MSIRAGRLEVLTKLANGSAICHVTGRRDQYKHEEKKQPARKALVQKRYFDVPYEFIPPRRGLFWSRLIRRMLPGKLRKTDRVEQFQFSGTEHLQSALAAGQGVLLAPNHCRAADPPVIGMLGKHVNRFFYYAASWHLFQKSKFDQWLLSHSGAFSIFREGIDRESLRECSRILATGERPLVLFAEGTWYRQNDRLGPLQEGMSLICRQAAKQQKRPIVVLPVAIKYWFMEDPLPAMIDRLRLLERSLHWHPQEDKSISERIQKLSDALLAIKEIEYVGQASAGDLTARSDRLAEFLLTQLERQYFAVVKARGHMERVRALRQYLVRKLSTTTDLKNREEVWGQLDQMWFCQQLYAHAQEYLANHPSLERLAEAILRIDEDVTDEERPLARMGAVVRIGPPIPVATAEETRIARNDPLIDQVSRAMQGMLDDINAQGPPPQWSFTQAAPTGA